jgi:hypothetical protein
MEDGVSDDYEIVFVCTDRGRHEEVLVPGGVDLHGDPNLITGYNITVSSSFFESSCELCPRKPRLAGRNLAKLYDHLLGRLRNGERRVTVDISMLPF